MLNPINVKYFKLVVPDIGNEGVNDISARCIVCGDSSTNKNKKRLHLYTKPSYDGDQIQCFNCGYSARPSKFFKDYGTEYYNSYLSEMGYSKIEQLKPKRIKSISTLKKEQEETTDVHSIHFLQDGIVPAKESKEAIEYIKSRNLSISDFDEMYYCNTSIQIDGKEINLKGFIIIPLMNGNNAYGFYSRSTHNKYFYTYLPSINHSWKVYNWFQVNKEEPVYIFEGIMDLKSTTLNGIAVLGSDIPPERLKELKEPIFVFDNDKTGQEKTKKYLSLGYKCVVYPKGITEKDCNEMLQTKSKEEISTLIQSSVKSGCVGTILNILK